MGELKNHTLRGVKWSAIENISTKGISFILGLILARLLVPEDYAITAMVGIFFAIAQTFIDSGFGSALIRKKDCSQLDYSTAFYFNIVAAFFFCVILWIAAPYIAQFYNQPILADITRVMSVNMFIGSFSIIQGTKLTAEINFKLQAKVSVTTTILSGCFGICLAYNGYGVWSLVFQGVFANILRTIMLWYVTKWRPSKVFSKASFKYLFSFGSKILTASLLHTIYANLTTIIIGKFYTPKDLGLYSRGESMATLPSANITGILQRVTFPILSKIQDDEGRLISAYRKYISITSLVIFFGMCMLAALGEPIIEVLLTEKWIGSVIYLQVFCFAWMFDHLCVLNLNILYVKGRSDLVLRLEVVKKTISISMIIAAIPFGVLAICLARALYTQIALYINTYYTGKLFGLGYAEQIKDYGKYFVFSLLACAPAYLLTFTELNSILVILLGGCIGCLIYWLFLRKDENLKELLSLIKKR